MGNGRWRHAVWGLVLPAAIAALAGCSGGGNSGATAASADKALTGQFSGADLRGALLTKVNGVGAASPASSGKYAALPATAAGTAQVTPKSCAGAAVQGFDPTGLSAAEAAAVTFKVSGNGVSEMLIGSSGQSATAALAGKLPAGCKSYQATVDGKTVKYAVKEEPVKGVGQQARALNLQSSTASANRWSVIYRGKGFIGTVNVTGPNASEKAAQELAQQAYAYAAKSLA